MRTVPKVSKEEFFNSVRFLDEEDFSFTAAVINYRTLTKHAWYDSYDFIVVNWDWFEDSFRILRHVFDFGGAGYYTLNVNGFYFVTNLSTPEFDKLFNESPKKIQYDLANNS